MSRTLVCECGKGSCHACRNRSYQRRQRAMRLAVQALFPATAEKSDAQLDAEALAWLEGLNHAHQRPRRSWGAA